MQGHHANTLRKRKAITTTRMHRHDFASVILLIYFRNLLFCLPMRKPLHTLHAPYSQRRTEPSGRNAPHNCLCPTHAQVQGQRHVAQVQGHHYNGNVHASCCSHQSACIVNSRAVITLFRRGSLPTSKGQGKCINASATLYLIDMKGSIFQILSCERTLILIAPLQLLHRGTQMSRQDPGGTDTLAQIPVTYSYQQWRGEGKQNHHSLQSGQPPGFI